MKAASLIPTAIVAIVCSLVVYLLMPPPEPAEPQDDEGLLARITELEGELEDLREERDAMRGEPSPAAFEGTTRSEDIDDLVARAIAQYFAANPPAAAGAGDAEALEPGELTEEQKNRLLEDSIRKFLDPNTDWDDGEKIWAALFEAGLMHEAIELLEAEVERDPNNANLLVQLGNAYLQPIMMGEAVGMQAGTWSMKADAMYDAALEIDDHNWDARLSKAISLSFWPPIMGKGPEAIRHFEILVDQQNGAPVRPEFVETYFLLGNMYQQAGESEKAAEVWNQGLSMFPDEQRLRESLGLE